MLYDILSFLQFNLPQGLDSVGSQRMSAFLRRAGLVLVTRGCCSFRDRRLPSLSLPSHSQYHIARFPGVYDLACLKMQHSSCRRTNHRILCDVMPLTSALCLSERLLVPYCVSLPSSLHRQALPSVCAALRLADLNLSCIRFPYRSTDVRLELDAIHVKYRMWIADRTVCEQIAESQSFVSSHWINLIVHGFRTSEGFVRSQGHYNPSSMTFLSYTDTTT